jgi:hypothetical protein
MNLYHVFCDLKPGVADLAFAESLARYLGHLREQGLIGDWRLSRRKLGLGPATLGEFHIVIEVKDLAQLDAAFSRVASRAEPVEGLHHDVNSLVRNTVFALYRDFPDPERQTGGERF